MDRNSPDGQALNWISLTCDREELNALFKGMFHFHMMVAAEYVILRSAGSPHVLSELVSMVSLEP